MQENENVIFGLNSYIQTKNLESDFSDVMRQCLKIQNEINDLLIQKTLSVNI